MTAQKKVESPEFMYLPLESIIVEEQIRSGIDTEGESFKALMESIKDRGALNSVIRDSLEAVIRFPLSPSACFFSFHLSSSCLFSDMGYDVDSLMSDLVA
jgi:hypothetical protein